MGVVKALKTVKEVVDGTNTSLTATQEILVIYSLVFGLPVAINFIIFTYLYLLK